MSACSNPSHQQVEHSVLSASGPGDDWGIYKQQRSGERSDEIKAQQRDSSSRSALSQAYTDGRWGIYQQDMNEMARVATKAMCEK